MRPSFTPPDPPGATRVPRNPDRAIRGLGDAPDRVASRLRRRSWRSPHEDEIHPACVEPVSSRLTPPPNSPVMDAADVRPAKSVARGRPGGGTFERPANPDAPGEGVRLRVTPRPLPVARLEVASSSHGRVRAMGLARFFPARTIHAQRSTAVVEGNSCRLQSIDHYHVHRVTAPLDPLMTDRDARHALRALLANPTDGGHVRQFQRELRRLATPAATHGSTRTSLRIHPNYRTSIMSCDYVQTGDGSRMSITTRYVVEESRLPIINMLAQNRKLVLSFVRALREQEPGEGRSAFLRDMRRVCRGVSDLDVIGRATDVATRDTWLASLFGLAVVDQAAAIMIGSRNELTTGTRVKRGSLHRRDLFDNLAWLRSELATRQRVPERDAIAAQPSLSRSSWTRRRA